MAYAEIARSAAQRATALTDVSRILGTASSRASAAGIDTIKQNARAPFELIEHEPKDVEAFLRWFAVTPEWRPDGNCFNRTMLGAHKLDEIADLGATPASNKFAAAIHIEQESKADFLATAKDPAERARFESMLSQAESQYADLSGRFHGTLVFRIKGHEDSVAVDFKAKRPLVHFQADRLPERTQLIRPYAGSGVWGGVSMRQNWVDHTYFDGAQRFLSDAISGSKLRIDRSAALEDAVAAVHQGYARPAVPDDRLMSRIVNDAVTFD